MNFILLITMSLTLNLYAQNYEPIKKNVFNKEVEGIKREANLIFDSITLNLINLEAELPDYAAVKNTLLDNIKTTREIFLNDLDTISSTLKSELEVEYAELAAIKKMYQANRNSAIKRLLNDKLARIDSKIDKLQVDANKIYSDTMYKLYSINNNYIYPINIDSKLDYKKSLRLGGVFVPFALVLPFTASLGAIWTSLLLSGAIGFVYTDSYGVSESGIDHGLLDLHTFKIMLSNGLQITSNDRSEIVQHSLGIQNPFNGCKTAGCVYLLAQNLKNYISTIKKLNRNVTVLDVIKLSKIKYSKRNIRKSIDKIAEVSASSLPVAEFTIDTQSVN